MPPRATLGNSLTPSCSGHKVNCLPRPPFVGPPRSGLCAPGLRAWGLQPTFCARGAKQCSAPYHTQNPPGSLPTNPEPHWLLVGGSTKQETNVYPLVTGARGPSNYRPLSAPSPASATHCRPSPAWEGQAGGYGASRQSQLGFLHRKEEQAEVGEEAAGGRK